MYDKARGWMGRSLTSQQTQNIWIYHYVQCLVNVEESPSTGADSAIWIIQLK